MALGTFSAAAAAGVSVSPLSSFGGGDGWLAPGEGGYAFLGTGNLERGLAFGNHQLYLVSRNGGVNIRRLDATTGADLGGLSNSGITGGTFAANMVAVSQDGAVYVGNLSTAAGTNFKVYRWANDASLPTVAYDAAPGAPRLGDSFALTGSGAGTRIAVSGTGTSGFLVVDPTAGTGTLVSVPGTATGDFRLGLTWVDHDTLIGAQGGTSPFRVVDISGSTGTLTGSPATTSSGERPIGYTVIAGVPLFASIDTVSAAVRIYDASNPGALQLLATANNTHGDLTANGNGVGSVAWGAADGNSAVLYALNGSQGVQAFVVTVPEPGAFGLLLLGAGVLAWRRDRRSVA